MIKMLKKSDWSVQAVLDGCEHITQNYCDLHDDGAQYVVEEALLIALAYSEPTDE